MITVTKYKRYANKQTVVNNWYLLSSIGSGHSRFSINYNKYLKMTSNTSWPSKLFYKMLCVIPNYVLTDPVFLLYCKKYHHSVDVRKLAVCIDFLLLHYYFKKKNALVFPNYIQPKPFLDVVFVLRSPQWSNVAIEQKWLSVVGNFCIKYSHFIMVFRWRFIAFQFDQLYLQRM